MQSYNVRDQLDTDIEYVAQYKVPFDRLHVNVTNAEISTDWKTRSCVYLLLTILKCEY